MRKIRKGISGDLERSSIRTKVARIAIEAISSRIVRAEVQPTSGAFEIA